VENKHVPVPSRRDLSISRGRRNRTKRSRTLEVVATLPSHPSDDLLPHITGDPVFAKAKYLYLFLFVSFLLLNLVCTSRVPPSILGSLHTLYGV
jgi:hypothetical protein